MLDRRLRHGGNAVLRDHADSFTVQQDAEGNVRPIEAKDGRKFQGMKALVMALDRALHSLETRSVYEDKTVLVL